MGVRLANRLMPQGRLDNAMPDMRGDRARRRAAGRLGLPRDARRGTNNRDI